MKNIVLLSAAAVFAMSSVAVAGGDITPVEEPVVIPVVVKDYAGAYIGIGYAAMNAPISNFNTFVNGDWFLNSLDADLSTNGFMVNAGYRFNAYIAIEGRYWGGGNDNANLNIVREASNVTADAGSIDADVDGWGIYVKPMYPVTEAFDIYAMLGYGSATFDQATTVHSGGGVHLNTESLDPSSFSWGLGLAYSFTENISIFADYIKVADEDFANPTQLPLGITDTKYELETYNIGIAYKF